MKFIFSGLIGALTGACAVLLHNSYPPFGAFLSVLGTFVALWSVGRKFGKRRYKIFAAALWLFVFYIGSNLGAGGELLVQGDNAGSTLLFFGVIALIVAVVLPA
jgi:hypothetical protein